jgi:hypothetical protein
LVDLEQNVLRKGRRQGLRRGGGQVHGRWYQEDLSSSRLLGLLTRKLRAGYRWRV